LSLDEPGVGVEATQPVGATHLDLDHAHEETWNSSTLVANPNASTSDDGHNAATWGDIVIGDAIENSVGVHELPTILEVAGDTIVDSTIPYGVVQLPEVASLPPR